MKMGWKKRTQNKVKVSARHRRKCKDSRVHVGTNLRIMKMQISTGSTLHAWLKYCFVCNKITLIHAYWTIFICCCAIYPSVCPQSSAHVIVTFQYLHNCTKWHQRKWIKFVLIFDNKLIHTIQHLCGMDYLSIYPHIFQMYFNSM